VYVVELASFRAHPSHVPTLVQRAGFLLHALRRRFPGLRRIHVAQVGDGSWLQLSFWDSREHAEAAASEVLDTPEMGDFLAQVDEFADAA
jgi:heme-degrading monooxygenase HmoA